MARAGYVFALFSGRIPQILLGEISGVVEAVASLRQVKPIRIEICVSPHNVDASSLPLLMMALTLTYPQLPPPLPPDTLCVPVGGPGLT